MQNENSSEKEIICVKSYKHYSKPELNRKLAEMDWKDWNNQSFECKTKNIIDRLKQCVKELISYKNINVQFKNNWFCEELRELKVKKEELYKCFMVTQSNDTWTEYKATRNEYVMQLENNKNNLIKDKIENCGNDQRQMWKLLKKEVLPKPNRSVTGTSHIIFDGLKETSAVTISEKFNDYFIDSIEEINKSIEVDTNKYEFVNEVRNNRFTFKDVNMFKLKEVLKTMNKKSDNNNINSIVMDDALDTIGEHFLNIINQSLCTGIFPNTWKEAIVVPIPKINGTKQWNEYRPINKLPFHEKILETIVMEQLQSYIDENSILIDQQSGFRKQHSCETALNFVVSNWKIEREEGNITVVVFLDFRRAFETIDRSLLIQKLQNYGILGKENDWFRSYLLDRSQITNFMGCSSTSRTNNLGVPQGSVLGPLLFIVYINDIMKSVKYCTVNLFADDTLMYVSGKNITEVVEKVNEDLKSLQVWLNQNKLKLNTEKTNYMFITNKVIKEDFELKVNNEKLNRVKETKYLGVVIDEKLKFSSNTSYILKKMAKKINFLGRIKRKVSISTRIKIYMSIIAPHIEYCSSILFLCNKGEIAKLQKLQNRGMRIILGMSRYTSSKFMRSCLKWMSVKQRIFFNVLVLVFKIKNNLVPKYLQKYIRYNSEVIKKNLRNKNDFCLPVIFKSENRNNLYFKGVKLFNDLPPKLKECKSLVQFKRLANIYIKINV